MTQFLGVDNCHGLGAPNLELHKLPGLRGYLSPLVNRLPLIDKAIRCFNLLRSHLRRDVLEILRGVDARGNRNAEPQISLNIILRRTLADTV